MIYLDNAATTYPKPPAVYENTFRFLAEKGGNPGRGGHFFANASSEVVEGTRRDLARFFDVPDFRRVVFTYNCTDSINIALKGYLRPGDHVITSHLDHNAISRPLERLRRKLPLEISRIPFNESGRLDPADFQTVLQRNTRLIILTHGSNVLGSVQPVGPFVEIARNSGVPLLLDAAQTAGRIDLQIGDAPVFVVCSGHKGLYGMPGIGILTVPSGIDLEKWREGGTGTTSESLQHPDELPMRLEAGTPNFLAIASLREGLRFLNSEGIAKMHQHEIQLAMNLQESLESKETSRLYSRLDSENSIGVVAFNLNGVPPEEAAAILDQNYGIAVRSGLHCAVVLHEALGTLPAGCLRVSPGYFNTDADMAALTAALSEITQKY